MLDKQVKQNPALLAMLGEQGEKESTKNKVMKNKEGKLKKDPRKINPQGYVRNRGKGGTKPMSYYLPDVLITALALKAAKEGKSKSSIVEDALRKECREYLKDTKKNSSTLVEEVI